MGVLTANVVEHTTVDVWLEIELLSISLLIPQSHQYVGRLVEDVDELFENFEMETWCQKTATVKPFLTVTRECNKHDKKVHQMVEWRYATPL